MLSESNSFFKTKTQQESLFLSPNSKNDIINHLKNDSLFRLSKKTTTVTNDDFDDN